MRLAFAGALLVQATISIGCQGNPLDEVLPVPSLTVGSPVDLRYRGDVAGFAESSVVLPTLTERGKVSLLALANAQAFTSDGVGYSGSLSPHATAFRNLLKEPRAATAFHELVRSRRPPAQLYGLSGLYLLDRAGYEQSARRLRASSGKVVTMIGCNLMEEPISTVIGTGTPHHWEIDNGYWPSQLAAQHQ